MIRLALGLIVILSAPAQAQDLATTFSQDLGSRSIYLIALITVLGIVPGLAVMVTCFPFIVTVLSILRQAIGLQQAPPNMLIVSLAMFLTWFVMDPVFMAAWTDGIEPLSKGAMTLEAAIPHIVTPFKTFMVSRVDPGTFSQFSELRGAIDLPMNPDAPLSLLVPSFLVSEVERAFEVGFLIFLPFLIIDLVVSAILMSMGMMMVPPAIVALPFKMAFFVVADGWALVSTSLVRGYMP